MKNGRYLMTGLIVVALLAVAVAYVKKTRPAGSVHTSDLNVKAKGPENAPIQMVEYSDFQCPACQRAQLTMDKFFSEPQYKDQIRLIFRHFPLPGHRWAGLAHQAAECAHREGRFWEYHDLLYQNQPKWAELTNPMEVFLGYAKQLELPLENFGLCLANPEVRQHVLDDKKKGDNVQLQSTPTLFINGERFVGPVEIETKGVEAVRHFLKLDAAIPSPTPHPSALPPAESSPSPAA